MKERYRVVIAGSGPSAIFSALPLAMAGVEDVAIFEKGKDIDGRKRGRGMELLCGWGGAGVFSDGKLTLSPKVAARIYEKTGQRVDPAFLTRSGKEDRRWR